MRNKARKSRRRTREARITDKNPGLRMDCLNNKAEYTEASESSVIATNILLLVGVVLLPVVLVAVGTKALINLYLGV